MPRPFIGIDIRGIKELEKELKKASKEILKEVDGAMEASVKRMEVAAKAAVPKETGRLHNSIAGNKKGEFQYELVADVDYAAYVEFGTGALVDVPKGLESYAIQFLGRGIKEVNLPAHPYLFPAYETERKELIKDIKAILNLGGRITVIRPGPSNITGITTI